MAAGRKLNGWRFVPVLLAPLAACSTVPPETPAEALARRELSCKEAGFAEDGPDFKLCLILQQTNDRLAAVERRLTWLEQDASLARPYLGPGWWW